MVRLNGSTTTLPSRRLWDQTCWGTRALSGVGNETCFEEHVSADDGNMLHVNSVTGSRWIGLIKSQTSSHTTHHGSNAAQIQTDQYFIERLLFQLKSHSYIHATMMERKTTMCDALISYGAATVSRLRGMVYVPRTPHQSKNAYDSKC